MNEPEHKLSLAERARAAAELLEAIAADHGILAVRRGTRGERVCRDGLHGESHGCEERVVSCGSHYSPHSSTG